MADEDPTTARRMPPWLAVLVAVLATLLLTVWAAFLVPLRLGGLPVPLWVVPLVVMLGVALLAGRVAGVLATVLPAALWFLLSWIFFGVVRSEGDLVVPGTTSGYAYLYGGALGWAAVVLGSAATPGPGTRR